MTDEKEDILSRIDTLILLISRSKIENEQIVTDLKDISALINNELE